MIDFTKIVRPLFMRRIDEFRRFRYRCESVQRGQLRRLLTRAAKTEAERRFNIHPGLSYEEFQCRMPLSSYENLRPYIMRMIDGERNVLCRGTVKNYAQSSGTSDGKSKYIPISRDSLSRCHYKGSFDVVAQYLNMNPDSRLFSGKGLILGGSFANELQLPDGVHVGDLSANLISNINPLANFFRVPNKKIALMPDWSEKLPAIVEASIKENITSISGVPSWMLTVLREVLKRTGASSIHDVWPNLEVFMHGGISFDPYRAQYDAICDPSKMHYINTYNASEGFFAVQSSPDSDDMLLLLDVGVFYEFIPIDSVGTENARAIPVWQVEPGRTYSLIITANNGLWRYAIGDTVTVTQIQPVKIRIAGRTKSYINAFGEELMVHNAEAAVARACSDTGAEVANFTAAPVYADSSSHGHHQWLIEFSRRPGDIERFADSLDSHLQEVNSDYEAKRSKGIFLDRLTIVEARQGLFVDWLASTGKLGGQRKVPRLSNDRVLIDQLLKMNENSNK
ncbi:MAG: GH3 auxin-responsive promoter family protein [Muribaculaceae bacterium]|jgi:hypothetical protein|nr:GH3 auxin-responsive promoter family protein [Muribaculaceae bacterium]